MYQHECSECKYYWTSYKKQERCPYCKSNKVLSHKTYDVYDTSDDGQYQ